MEEFKTIENAEELFRGVNGLGENNCILVALKDTRREGIKYGAMGAVGGAVGGAIAGAFASGVIDGMNRRSDGYLINWTEKGLGIIPLDATGLMMVLTASKLKADVSSYFFVSNDQIDSIVVKNFNFFSSGTKSIVIKLKNNQKLHLMARVNEKGISYQAENVKKFAENFKK